MSFSATNWDYGARRTADYRDIAADPRFAPADFLEPLFERLPFRLGESSASTIVPYAFDDLFAETLDGAVDGLAFLLLRRREALLAQSPSSAVGGQGMPFLGAPHYSLSPFAGDACALNAAVRAIRFDPLLDAGVMSAWLSTCGGGALLRSLTALYAKTFAEDVRRQARTPLTHLAWTATLDAAEAAKSRAKPLVSRTLPWEKLEKAIGFAVFALAQAAILPVLSTLTSQNFNFSAQSYRRALTAGLTPLAFCSIPRSALQDDINPWGLAPGIVSELERLWFALLDGEPSPFRAAELLEREILTQPDLMDMAAQAGAIRDLRQALFVWLDANREADDFVLQPILQNLRSDAGLFKIITSPKVLEAPLRRYSEMRHLEPDASGSTLRLLELLRKGTDARLRIRAVANAFFCWALDQVTAHTLLKARGMLRDQRSGQATADELQEAYLQGRLYRLSADRHPTLCALSVRESGHLFVDLKGFTQRTYRAKEIVMADFLRTEFYEPILDAAARCGRADDGGKPRLSLQNLPGDAAVFSGDITALVALAQEIWHICRTYGEKLQRRLARSGSAQNLKRQEVESLLKQRLIELENEAASMAARIDACAHLSMADKEKLWEARLNANMKMVEAQIAQQRKSGDTDALHFSLQAREVLERQNRDSARQLSALKPDQRDARLGELLCGEEKMVLTELRRQMEEEKELARVRLKALEAEEQDMALDVGLFIGYGAAAETVALDSPAFGSIRVAIAEKINEAARGTSRSGHLRERLEAQLSRERRLRGNSSITCPFRVLLAPELRMTMPPELSELMLRAIRGKDATAARSAAQGAGQLVLRELARAMGQGDGRLPESLSILNDIYNVGEALSGEALQAYLSATAATRHWFRKVVPVESLDAEIRSRFFFPTAELDLTVSLPLSGAMGDALIFRRAGQMKFRGFEAKAQTVIYEMLRRQDDFFRLLAERHLTLWAGEHLSAGRTE